MTRFLTLVALGLAVALAPTRGEAQILVPDYFGLLEQDQNGDGFITGKDFSLSNTLGQQTKACRLSPNYKNLPKEDKTKLNTLYNLACGISAKGCSAPWHKTNEKVPGITSANQAREAFLKKHPGLRFDPAGC